VGALLISTATTPIFRVTIISAGTVLVLGDLFGGIIAETVGDSMLAAAQ
jgi:hypothetical protein